MFTCRPKSIRTTFRPYRFQLLLFDQYRVCNFLTDKLGNTITMFYMEVLVPKVERTTPTFPE